MAEILISNQIWNKPQFKQVCGKSLDDMLCCGQGGVMWPYEPYTIGKTTPEDKQIISALRYGGNPRNPRNPRNLHQLSATVGEDNIVGVGEAMVMLHDTTAVMAGSAATAHASRSNNLVISVQHYQDALLSYRNIMQTGATTASKASAGLAISTAFEHMQKQFQHELRMTTGVQKASRRGTPLSNRTRAMNIARSSRSIEKLQLVSTLQAGKLGRFSKYGKALGNGLIVVDVASRIGNVQNEYKAEGNWERELFIESSSFVASSVMGLATVKAGVTFLILATPAGWVGLIVAAAGASMGMNYLVKEGGGGIYDSIMEWVNSW